MEKILNYVCIEKFVESIMNERLSIRNIVLFFSHTKFYPRIYLPKLHKILSANHKLFLNLAYIVLFVFTPKVFMVNNNN